MSWQIFFQCVVQQLSDLCLLLLAVTVIILFISALLFAAVFGNVSAIIYGHYSGTFKFRERMQSVKYFLGFHKIKGPLARKVKDYARHMWTQTKGISTVKVTKIS